MIQKGIAASVVLRLPSLRSRELERRIEATQNAANMIEPICGYLATDDLAGSEGYDSLEDVFADWSVQLLRPKATARCTDALSVYTARRRRGQAEYRPEWFVRQCRAAGIPIQD